MIRSRSPLRSQRGLSMVEVLIAVLIFSLGLMGLGGLLIFAIQANHVSYLRTQATFLAHNMADRMSANPTGVWNGSYNGTYPMTVSHQDCASGCTPADLATHDQEIWSSQLKTFLPNDGNLSATIDCENKGTGYTPTSSQLAFRPPYGGQCSMTIAWTEHGTDNSSANAGGDLAQTFQWVFQP